MSVSLALLYFMRTILFIEFKKNIICLIFKIKKKKKRRGNINNLMIYMGDLAEF